MVCQKVSHHYKIFLYGQNKNKAIVFKKWSHDFTLALCCKMSNRALPKAQRTQGIESLNFIEFFKLINESRSFFNLVMFGKEREIHVTISYYNTIAKAYNNDDLPMNLRTVSSTFLSLSAIQLQNLEKNLLQNRLTQMTQRRTRQGNYLIWVR